MTDCDYGYNFDFNTLPLGTTWAFFTLDSHLLPIRVLALTRPFVFISTICDKLGRFFCLTVCNSLEKFVSVPWIFFVRESLPLFLHISSKYINQVVIKFNGDGVVVVLCMFLINFANPNFHSISDWAWFYSQIMNITL